MSLRWPEDAEGIGRPGDPGERSHVGGAERDACENSDGDRTFTDRGKAAVRSAMNLLVNRDRSEQELRGRLAQKGFGEEEIGEAIAYVSSFGYLNDRRFAEVYVASYAGKKSRMAIESDLTKRGIDTVCIEEALATLPEDETEIMRALLEKRAGAPHILDDRELRRHSAFLARKGYASGDIWRVLRAYQDAAEEM